MKRILPCVELGTGVVDIVRNWFIVDQECAVSARLVSALFTRRDVGWIELGWRYIERLIEPAVQSQVVVAGPECGFLVDVVILAVTMRFALMAQANFRTGPSGTMREPRLWMMQASFAQGYEMIDSKPLKKVGSYGL